MKTKHLSLLIGLVVAVLAVVAILFGFANAFLDTNDLPDGRGTLFNVMFGQGTDTGYQAVPLLIAGFVMLIVAAVFAVIFALFPARIVKVAGFGLVALLLVVAGIFAFFASTAWIAANSDRSYPIVGDATNGVGPIGMGISALLGAFLAAYNVTLARKL